MEKKTQIQTQKKKKKKEIKSVKKLILTKLIKTPNKIYLNK